MHLRTSLAIAGLVLLTGCSASTTPAAQPGPNTPSAPLSTPPSSSATSSGANEPWVVQRIHTGGQPCATLGAAGSVWVADISGGVVKRLDPSTGHTIARLKTDPGPCGMAYGAKSIWVENYTASTVTRIDIATNKVKSIKVGTSPYDVTFAGHAAWVTNYADGTVTRIDARTDKTTTIKVGDSPVGIAAAAGDVWVADSGSAKISRIDVATRKVTTVPFHGSPFWTAADRNTVWIGDQSHGELVQIDARRGVIVRRIKVGPTPNDGDVFAGKVWFPDKDGSLYRVDEKTGAVSGPFPLGAGNPFVVSGYAGRLWVADYGGTDTVVVDPSRLPAAA